MGNDACAFCPKARNRRTGKEVPSKLFMDLLGYHSNDRQLAKEDYATATSQEFREMFGDKVVYDECDEPTATSYLKLSEANLKKEQIIKRLNKELGAGTYNYSEADARRQAFENSTSSDVNEDYTVVMIPAPNGECTIEIRENTAANRALSIETLKNKNLFDRIKNAVRALGGDVSFIDERYSMYDPRNAEKLANGLYGVIKLGTDGEMSHNLAHEAGHFAVGALGNHPLVQRLRNAMNPDSMPAILGEEEWQTAQYTSDPQREAMGALVGKYIEDEVDKKLFPTRLLDKVINATKKMFYSLSGNTVARMQVEAQETAEQIARNFLSQKNAGKIETALESDSNPLYSITEDGASTAFKGMLTKLSLMAKEVGAFDKVFSKALRDSVARAAGSKLENSVSLLNTNMSIAGILDTLVELQGAAGHIEKIFEELPRDFTDFTETNRWASSMRSARVYLDTLESMLSLVEPLLDGPNMNQLDMNMGAIKQLHDELKVFRETLSGKLAVREKGMFLNFLKTAYGKDYIERAARTVFRDGKVVAIDGEKIKLDTLVTETNYARDWLEKWVSMADSYDPINQIIYKATQAFNTAAQQSVLQALDDIRELEQYCLQNKINTEKLFEKYTSDVEVYDADGNLELDEKGNPILAQKAGGTTGNYISPLNWGDWEANYNETRKQLVKKFQKQYPNYQSMLKEVYDFRLAEFCHKALSEWHRKNSYYNNDTGRYEPLGYQKPNHPNAGAYTNSKYYDLTDAEREAVNRFLEIKQSADGLLTQQTIGGDNSFAVYVCPVRMPQFRNGNIIDETRNAMKEQQSYNVPKHYGKTLWRKLIAAFTHQANDEDYGNEATKQVVSNIDPNDPNAIYDDGFVQDVRDIRRVATYGINKFSNMELLTHDLFAGALQYVSMAQTYNMQYKLGNLLEVGSEVLLNREVGSSRAERENIKKKDLSDSYRHYQDFLNCQIYNLYANGKRFDFGKFATEKAIGTMNGIMAKLYLAGNVAGAAVNLGTGMIEIFKEAAAGSSFDVKDMLWADKQFGKNIVTFNWIRQAGKENPDDRLSLFLQKFDAGNHLYDKVRSYNTHSRTRRTLAWAAGQINPFSDDAMTLYSTGDYYMQGVSYLAMARKVKLRTKDGGTVNLWNALNHEPISGDKGPKTLRYNDDILETRAEYDKDGNIKRTYHVAVIEEPDENGRMITREINWEDEGQATYQDHCRELNNRMHGIYNKMDKTRFHNGIIGKLLSTMKGYAFGYAVRKLSSNRFSVVLNKETEGEWLTSAKIIMGILNADYKNENADSLTSKVWVHGARLGKGILSIVLPHGNAMKRVLTNAGYSDEQFRNCKRTWWTLILSILTYYIAKMTKDAFTPSEADKKRLQNRRNRQSELYQSTGVSGDDLKAAMEKWDARQAHLSFEDRLAGVFGYYLCSRLNAEQAAWQTIKGVRAESASLSNLNPISLNFFVETSKLIGDLASGDEVTRGAYKGKKKYEKDIFTKLPYIKSYPVWNDPYTAYSNWEYGRKVGQ